MSATCGATLGVSTTVGELYQALSKVRIPCFSRVVRGAHLRSRTNPQNETSQERSWIIEKNKAKD